MPACLYLLTVLLAVVLCAATQALPIIISAPESIAECEQTAFIWWGGDAPYSFYYGAGHDGFGNDDGVETETLVQDGIIGPAVEFDAPSSEGLPWRFRVADETQNATRWMYIQPSNSCGSSTSTITITGSPSPPPFTITPTPFTTTPVTTKHHLPPITTTIQATSLSPPYQSYTYTLSSPHGTTTTANGPPVPTGSTGLPGSTAPTTVIATTTKQTNIPPNPTPNPADPSPNPNSPPGSNVSSGNPPSGSGGTSGATDGSTSSGGTRTTPDQPTGGTNGGNPTQTASPVRNTESQDSGPVPMSAQARVAVIGTITGAFVLFIAFLCFRWRKRHQKKHRPVPILPRIGNSGDDITVPVTPPYDYSPPINGNHPMGVFALRPRLVPSPPRVLPSSKQAMAMAPRRSSSAFGSEASIPISAGTGTWLSEHGETSRADSASGYPDNEMPPLPLGHISAPSSSHERYLRPTGPSPMPPPLSLQQLIGRELDNILSSPGTYSPDTPLYTPTSISARDLPGCFRVANDTEQCGRRVASTSKHPHALTEGSNSQKGERVRGSPVLSSAESRGGGPRQRVPISRHEMEYLADLVAARITRDSTQRTEQNQSGTGRHGPPPSYI